MFPSGEVLVRPAILVANVAAVTCITFSIFMAGCGSGSGQGSGNGSGGGQPPSNPAPAIASLSPNFATQGGSALSVTITGYNFMSSSTAQWNGSARTTTYNSSTQLQVQLTAADIATAGSGAVSVTNLPPGGGNSGSTEFTIRPTSNPVPQLQASNPSSVDAGSADIIFTVYGSNFIPTSVIQWNGVALTTSYLSESYLEAQVPASNLSNPGGAEVVVVNPGPGGGVSTPLPFAINGFSYTPLVVSQLANDMVWDPINQVIYLSVPSLASSNGNAIATLNPTTGNVQSTQFAGSEPDALAISNDSHFLYAGLDGSSSVQRFTLPGVVPDINYLLGAGAYPAGPYFAVDLQVAPSLPHTSVVSNGSWSETINNGYISAAGGMAVFDDATQRSQVADAAGNVFDSLQWGSDTQIYAINNEVTNFDFYLLTVTSGGVHLSDDYQNEFSDFYVRLHYDSGTDYAYTDDGYVINPANGQHVGQFEASGYMIPDSSLNSAFFLGQTQSQAGSTTFTIESFNLTTFQPMSEIAIANVRGYPLRLIRWGASGLAFNDDAGFIYIINSSFVRANAEKKNIAPKRTLFPVMRSWQKPVIRSRQKVLPEVRSPQKIRTRRMMASPHDSNPAPAITALSPSSVEAGYTGLTGFTLTVTGSNFVSLSTVEWNGSPQQTELVSSTELQAQISFSDVQNAGTATVSVATPSPGGGTSNTLTFTIVDYSSPPIPSIIALTPNSAVAGGAGLLVTPSGYWLNNSDTVDWNGNPRTNTSQGYPAAQVNASDLTTPGYAQVTVVTPGGVVSNAAEFQILYQPTAVNQSTNDMVWDPVNEVFYISVPSSATTNANQVCVLNPATNGITNCQAGNQPNVLAISDDSQFLYVGMDGSNSVRRYVLPNLTPDINFSVGTDPYDGPYVALDIEVSPATPHTVAISRGILNLVPDTEGGIAIYDDGLQRPTFAQGWGPTTDSYDSIQWGKDATAIYAANSSTTGFDFYTLTVNASGVVLDQDYPSVFWYAPGRIQYDSTNGLVYSDDGFHVVNPAIGLPAGLIEGGGPMVPDSSLDSVFVLTQYVWQENSNYTIDIFDMSHYVRVGWIPFPTTAQLGFNPLGRLIRWGSNGLAVNFKGDQIYLLSGSFVSAQNKSGTYSYKRPHRNH